ncbi:MAG: putative baseplate assembly protein [Planctomycetota bacterium]
MIEAVAKSPELRAWTARQSDDYGIALIEMWAYLADILTFYQERIANEAFLRTALHRDTIMRLAAMLDYKLNPGVAACAYLAFFAEDNTQVNIPVGLRMQSVPGQDEKPQKFETVEAVIGKYRLNQVRIFPRPQAHNPLTVSSTQGVLNPASSSTITAEVAQGDKLVIFPSGGGVFATPAMGREPLFGSVTEAGEHLKKIGLVLSELSPDDDLKILSTGKRIVRFFDPAMKTWIGAIGRRKAIADKLLKREMTRVVGSPVVGAGRVEEKKVEGFEMVDWQTIMKWSPGIHESWSLSDARVFKWIRKIRIFGHNAPPFFLKPEPIPDTSEIRWKYVKADDPGYKFKIHSGNVLQLDDLHDDLKVGTYILILDPDFTQLAQITATQQVEASKGPLSGTVTEITLADSFQAINDLREVVIYELVTPEITFWKWKYPEKVNKGSNNVYVLFSKLKNLETSRVLILDDNQKKPEVVTVTAVSSVDVDNDGEKDHLAITFTPGLTRDLYEATAQLYGNIAKVTHGETISNEILGNGDASQSFQEFSLKKSPTTFVPSTTAPTGAQNTLEVRIGGVLWKEAGSLYGQKADDEIYITRVDDEAKMTVRFGDGETGARLPTGQDNVVAKYRQGLGGEGNVAANSITTLLDRPTGLKSVTNPEKAKGGTDPESLQDARKNAPNTVRTFERAISLRDYEDLARSYTGIAKAKAVKVFKNENEMVQLTIAGEKGQKIDVASPTYENFLAFLDLHRDINHLVHVKSHDNKYLTVKAIIEVDPTYLTENVISTVKKAVLRFFDFDNLQLGQGIHLSDIYAVIQAVDGVTATLINYLDYETSASHSLNAHLLIEPELIAALNEVDLEILSDLT